MKKAILLSVITLIFAVSAQAQDDPIAKALEQTANRLAVAEEKNRLLEEQLKAKDAQIAAKDAKIELREEQLALSKSAGQDRAQVNTIDQFRVEACQTQLAKADAEIYRLKNPGFLRSLFDPKTFMSGAVGFGIGYSMKK